MWSYFKVGTIATCLVMLLLASGLVRAEPLPAGVQVIIEPIKQEYEANDQILIRLTYTNNGANTVRLLRWATGLNGQINEDFLSVVYAGNELSYYGPIFKRFAPQASDYVELRAGESVSRVVDLQSAYPIAQSGEYLVAPRWLVEPESIERHSSTSIDDGSTTQRYRKFTLIENRALPSFAQPARVPSAFLHCSSNEINAVNSAMAVAENYAGVARDSLNNAPEAERPSAVRYRTWFGAYDAQRWASVQNNFSRIYSTISGRQLTFICGDASNPEAPPNRCESNTIAYVFPSQHYNIYLCDAYWRIPTTGTDSRAGTIVHEVSHFQVVSDTDDHAYGQTQCRDLANTNPSRAIQNADNFEYFAENTPSLPMPSGGGSNPGPSPNPGPEPEPQPEPEPEPLIPAYLAAIIAFLFDD